MNLLHWRTRQGGGENEPSPWAGLRHEIDKLVGGFVREPLGNVEWPFGSLGKWAPPIEIVESDDAVVVRAELPGIDPNGLDVTAAGGRLVIAGDKLRPEHGASEVCRCEVRYGTFRRSIPLPEEVDIEKIEATYHHGVLTLRLPKQTAGVAQRVHIKVAAERDDGSQE